MRSAARGNGPALHRRHWLVAMLAFAGTPVARGQPVAPQTAAALPQAAQEAIDEVLRGRTPTEGRVTLELPKLAENGLSVPMTVRAASPMTAADHVHTLHVIAPANPVPTVTRLHFTPRSGEAFLSTRIRLADTQRVLALAETSDGQVFSGQAHVVVTLGGCVDPVL